MASLDLPRLDAILHTRMDRVNSANAAALQRAKALEAMMPSLSSYLGEAIPEVRVICEPGASKAADTDALFEAKVVDYAAAAAALVAEGPVEYTDLRMGLQFAGRQVEVWIDCVGGVAASAVPVSDRFLFLFEPDEVTKLRATAVKHASEFGHVFTHDPATVAALPASRCSIFHHGGTWILPGAVREHAAVVGALSTAAGSVEAAPSSHGDAGRPLSASARWARRPKVFATSFVCGAKQATQGHRLRQAVWAAQAAVVTPKRFFASGVIPGGGGPGGALAAGLVLPAPPSAKVLCFDTMFHVAVENVRQANYFTEKLIDCFLTRTVPVYWGCPNIGDFFDLAGIIIVSEDSSGDAAAGAACVETGSHAEATSEARVAARVVAVLSALTPDDYHRRSEAIARNLMAAAQFVDQRGRMERAIATATATAGL